ncbi:MAG: TolC family protein [Chlamydiales bacterium]|nr:TolC family protein [Chlamydiia bacterium]MCP5508542.1 TolC family protein [Chlamydiales bacterium]
MTTAACSRQVCILLCLAAMMLTGCRVYHVHCYREPCVEVPNEFYQDLYGGEGLISEWWKEFNQPQLNELVSSALESNLDIRQAWSRLAQARANVCIVSSAKYPYLELKGSAEYKNEITDTESGAETTFLLNPKLTYEIDLWKRIDSLVKAATLTAEVSQEDLEATALVLSGTVTDLWFTILEQKALLKLFDYQTEVNRTLLDLVELRFSIGEASALNVYQQQLQLENTIAQYPPVIATLQTSINQLYVLLGQAPKEDFEVYPDPPKVELPEFPNLGTPGELLCRRPDLRAAQRKLMAADYDVAAAVADLYPKVTLPWSYETKAGDISDLFAKQILKIAIEALEPIYDANKRCCEVYKRKAIVQERLDAYGQLFLNALREVEDAVVREKTQLDLVKQIQKEVGIAQLNLREARIRNANGLDDYLTVIAAIQSLQNLQRREINEYKRLLANRAALYRALGAQCLLRCIPRDEGESCQACFDNEGACCEY